MDRTSIKAGLKFCGGCNPTFPRLKFVKELTASLDIGVKWVSFEDKDISRLLIVNGCEIACVDPKKFKDRKLTLFSVSGDEPGVQESFLSFMTGGDSHD